MMPAADHPATHTQPPWRAVQRLLPSFPSPFDRSPGGLASAACPHARPKATRKGPPKGLLLLGVPALHDATPHNTTAGAVRAWRGVACSPRAILCAVLHCSCTAPPARSRNPPAPPCQLTVLSGQSQRRASLL